ncbi:MAG TPA: DUF4118 domain-containing protein [Dermatophilaceae bacterium]|nr:DUF4118 domain-containing protein [Dermatophilaceae bacterium]
MSENEGMLPWRHTWIGLLAAVVLLPSATLLLTSHRDTLTLPTDLLVFLVLVAVVAALGGLVPGVVAVVAAVGLLNYYFTPPLHTFAVADAQHVLALAVFVGAAVLVSTLVASARRRGEQAAAAAASAAAARRADETRTALLRAVSHDLRTPLASARAAVDGLRAPNIAAREGSSAELLATADASLARLSRLVEDLLDLSRLEAGAVSAFPRALAVEDIAAQAVRELEGGPDEIQVVVPEDVPEMWCDPGLLDRVLVSLLSNALRHHRGTEPVLIHARHRDAQVCIDVIDRGAGVPSGERERIFEPFQRLGDTDSRTGLGLGLAVARGLSRAMGGDVAAYPTPGGGLTMTVTMPAQPATGTVPPGSREHAGEPG